MKLCVFYHALFLHKRSAQDQFELYPGAFFIVREQMRALEESGLLDACDEFVVGLNGPCDQSMDYARLVIPHKAKIVLHGPQSFAENLTICKMEEFARSHSGWALCYHHSKSCTHDQGSDYGKFATKWRRCMEETVIWNWKECVKQLQSGFEAVGNHWLTGQGWDKSQHYFAGNFYWVLSDFFATIPSMHTRERIKLSGIASAESRFESEVVLGNAPRLPKIKDLATHPFLQCP